MLHLITLYIKRNNDIKYNSEFSIFDALGNQKYCVVPEKNPINTVFRITDLENNIFSRIIQNNFINNKFLVFYDKQRLLISNTIISANCEFHIYGMPWFITGNAAFGNYALIDVDNSVIMTHKKVWNNNSYYSQIEITNHCLEIPALSIAVCMNLYISLTEENKSSIPNV